jgi:LDH2 family malate/lactate/ureidoglycolate dehydrogenase
MNKPPTTFLRVAHDDLHRLVREIGIAAGLTEDRADLLAELLVINDLRGVFSHGTTQIANYAPLLREGHLNARPDVHVVRETPTSVLIDGDGGLGYFPAWDAAARVVEKAKVQGIAVGVTRNHGHFGAAGLYARRTLAEDLLSFVTSGHQLHLVSGHSLASAGGGSPMAFSAPANEETSLILDCGTMLDLYPHAPLYEEIARRAPGIFFRGLGMGAICQSWGGLLTGIPLDPSRAQRAFRGANQGSLILAFRIDLFADPAEFKREMDEYVRGVRRLEPLPGFSESFLSGGIEAEREHTYREEGIPVGEKHRERLESIATDLGIRVPWA